MTDDLWGRLHSCTLAFLGAGLGALHGSVCVCMCLHRSDMSRLGRRRGMRALQWCCERLRQVYIRHASICCAHEARDLCPAFVLLSSSLSLLPPSLSSMSCVSPSNDTAFTRPVRTPSLSEILAPYYLFSQTLLSFPLHVPSPHYILPPNPPIHSSPLIPSPQ